VRDVILPVAPMPVFRPIRSIRQLLYRDRRANPIFDFSITAIRKTKYYFTASKLASASALSSNVPIPVPIWPILLGVLSDLGG
jgi:hypothetical protein